MTDTITTAAPALSEGISYSERTRLVAEARPNLIKAMEKAGQEYYALEVAWQEEAARQQRAAGMPERCLESPYRRALREAATAVTDAFDEMVVSGQIDAKN